MTKYFRRAAALPVAALLWSAAAAPSPAVDAAYHLRFGDAIGVTVIGRPELSVESQPIRPDGRIALPLAGDQTAAGRTIPELTAALRQAYLPFVQRADVVVHLTHIRPIRIKVIGQVVNPGTYSFDEAPDLAGAISAAGGFTERAAHEAVKVVEPGKSGRTYDMDSLLQGGDPLPEIREGMLIDVGEVWYPDAYRLVPVVASVLASAVIIVREWPWASR